MVLKRRFIFMLAVAVIASLLLTFPAAASAGDSDWSIWDLLGGIGDFISDAVDAVLNGLKSFFIPSSDYFNRSFTKIRDNFNSKFGGIISTANYLSKAFKDLKAYRGSSSLFVVKFPKNHLFGGKSVDLMAGSEGIANIVRMALSGMVTLFTVAFAYKKVVSMIKN